MTSTRFQIAARTALISASRHRLLTGGASYDANGNMTAIPGMSGLQYDRDTNGLDYARNRYYSSAMPGRFLTPDPYQASARLDGPASWNRYSYVEGDPVNANDPTGLYLPVAPLPAAPPASVAATASLEGTLRMLGLADYEHYELFLAHRVGSRSTVATSLDYILDATMRSSDRIFDPDCAGLFLSSDANTPEQRRLLSRQLQTLGSAGWIRSINRSSVPADTPPGVAGFTTETFGLIYFIKSGPFFTGQVNGSRLAGAFTGLSHSQAQELMVIHEYLHWWGVGPDNANQQVVFANGDKATGSEGISEEVRTKCFK